MVAMMGWACTIKKPFDEKTGEESLPDLTYESVPNPRPSPFKSRISVREGRINILKKAMKG